MAWIVTVYSGGRASSSLLFRHCVENSIRENKRGRQSPFSPDERPAYLSQLEPTGPFALARALKKPGTSRVFPMDQDSSPIPQAGTNTSTEEIIKQRSHKQRGLLGLMLLREQTRGPSGLRVVLRRRRRTTRRRRKRRWMDRIYTASGTNGRLYLAEMKTSGVGLFIWRTKLWVLRDG